MNKNELKELEEIGRKIEETAQEMKEHYNGGVIQHALLSDLFEWLNNNGGCVFINKKTKKLKTQDNIIENYMTKYGIKFQVISCHKYHKCVDLRIKVL